MYNKQRNLFVSMLRKTKKKISQLDKKVVSHSGKSDEDLTNAFNEFFSKIEKQLSIFETSAGQINTSNIQEPISTTIDKYKKHSSILKTKKNTIEKRSCREYGLIINKHNQKLTSIMENQR